MGMKLMQYYKYVNDEMGLKGKMLLATETNVPSTKAALEPDSAENLIKFKKVIEEITGKQAPDF